MDHIYTGHVQNGVIVPDPGTPPLPEGSKVRFATQPHAELPQDQGHSLLELIDQLDRMGSDPHWPEDAARQHDHYLYGSTKKP